IVRSRRIGLATGRSSGSLGIVWFTGDRRRSRAGSKPGRAVKLAALHDVRQRPAPPPEAGGSRGRGLLPRLMVPGCRGRRTPAPDLIEVWNRTGSVRGPAVGGAGSRGRRWPPTLTGIAGPA